MCIRDRGDDHFGTLTAYVAGSESDRFRFTSALPVQVLKGMEPILNHYLAAGTHTQCQPPRNHDMLMADSKPSGGSS